MRNNYLHMKRAVRAVLLILLLGAVGMTKAMAQTYTNTLEGTDVSLTSAPIGDIIEAKTVGVIPYSEDFITKEEVMEWNYAITSFRMIDTATVAVLTGASDMILVYSLNENQILRKIQLPISARAFDYDNNLFHVIGDRTYLTIDAEGMIRERKDFKQPHLPNEEVFVITDLKVIDGQPIIHECHANTYGITSDGLQKIDTFYCDHTRGFKIHPKYIDENSLVVYNETPSRSGRLNVSMECLGLEGKLSCLDYISVDNDFIAINIETTYNHTGGFLKSYLLVINPNGELINLVEVPINFLSYIHKPFSYKDNAWYYAFSGQEGISIFKIGTNTNRIDSPDSSILSDENIDYFCREPVIGTSCEDTNNNDSTRGNWRTMTQAWYNGHQYCTLDWTPIPDNVATTCTWVGGSGAGFIITPISNSNYPVTGVLYKKLGFTYWQNFKDFASEGRFTGNMLFSDNVTCDGHTYESTSDAFVLGVDCSGFVSRCLELSSHTGTGQIASSSDFTNYGLVVGANSSTFQKEDVLNKTGNPGHARLYTGHVDSEQITVFESSGSPYWKTHDATYRTSACSGYYIMRYNYMRNIILRLYNSITMSQNGSPVTTVTRGQPLTVNYSVKNFGSETWSGNVRLVIEQSTGEEVPLNPVYSATLAPGESQSFTFSNNEVISPVGTTKFYVRVKNYNAGGDDVYYDVGDGGFANPLVFQIVEDGGGGGSTTCNSCPDYDETWSITGNGTWTTKSSSIGTNGCRIYRVQLSPSYTYTFETGCDQGTATFDTQLYLFNSSCTQVAYNDDGCSNHLSKIEYTNTGNTAYFYLKIDGYNGAGGSFTIAAKRVAGASPCSECPDYDETWNILTDGEWQTRSSSIDTDGCRIYRVALLPSYTYTFQTCGEGSATFDTQLYLYNASCNEVVSDDDGCTGTSSSLNYTNTGNAAFYYLKINGYNGAGGSFTIAGKRDGGNSPCTDCPDYDESWSINNVEVGDWTYKSSSIGTGGCRIYRVPLLPSYTYTFQTGCDNGTADFDTRLYLYDASCNEVAYDDDGCSNHLSSLKYRNTTGSTAYYYLKINGYDDEGGSYTIAAKRESCSSCPEYDEAWNINNVGEGEWTYKSSSIVSGGCSIYRVRLNASYTYTFQTGCGNGTADFDTQLYLYDSSCDLVAEDDDGCSNLLSSLEYTNTTGSNAYYYLKINGFGSASGSYTIAAKRATTFVIDASASPSAGGTVSGAGTYQSGSTCTLTAMPATGYSFVRWTKNGSQVSTSSTYSFTVTESASYVAEFSLNSYTISVSANPSAGGTVSGAGSYNHGSSCTLTANANTGYSFVRWTKNGSQVSTSSTYSFTVTEAASYVAEFSLNSYTISASANPSAGGTVSGAGAYNYGSTCTLTANAKTGYSFVRWTKNGSQVSTSSTYSFTVTEAASYVAVFSLNSYTISASANPSAGGTVSGAGTYNYGSTCTLTASPNTGYNFVRWTKNGSQVSTSSTYSFTVTGNASYVAVFEQSTITQSQTLSNGWNWWSSYVELNGADGLTMLENSLGSDGLTIKSRLDGYVDSYQYNGTTGWFGSLISINNEQMYKINMSANHSMAITGILAGTSSHPITISNGWNWIGFPLSQSVGVAEALSGFSPAADDVLKGRNGYTTYFSSNGTVGWYGSLNTLEPGSGYMYQSQSSGTKTLVFQTGRNEALVANLTPENNVYQPSDQRFADNMTVTAVVETEDEELRSDGYELAAFADDECRGSVRLLYVEPIDRYVAFLTVFGEQGDMLEFRLTDGLKTQVSADELAFASDGMVGMLALPKVLHFGTLGVGETSVMVRIYPNPVRRKGMLNIALPETSGTMTVEISNMLGVTVFRNEVVMEPTSVARITLPDAVVPGTYIMKAIRADGTVYYGKLVVE